MTPKRAPTEIQKTEILVVGAGPVRRVAGLCGQAGLGVTLLKRNFRGYARGHATLLPPSSLRLLGELGLSLELLREGRRIESVTYTSSARPPCS